MRARGSTAVIIACVAGVWKGTEREFFKTPFSFPQTLARPSRFPRAQNLLFPPFQTPATQATVIIEDSTPLTQIPKGESKNKKERERKSLRKMKVGRVNWPSSPCKITLKCSQVTKCCPALLLSVSRRQLSAWSSNLGLKVCFLNITLLVTCMLFVQASRANLGTG